MMTIENLQIAENSMRCAANDLRHAWRVMRENGMEATAYALADTVLDVETASQQIADFIKQGSNKY